MSRFFKKCVSTQIYRAWSIKDSQIFVRLRKRMTIMKVKCRLNILHNSHVPWVMKEGFLDEVSLKWGFEEWREFGDWPEV